MRQKDPNCAEEVGEDTRGERKDDEFGESSLHGCIGAILTLRKMREIAEIEMAIQGGTEKIETLGMKLCPLCSRCSNFLQVNKGKWKSL